MFLFDIPVAGVARQGSKTVQLRLMEASWPYAQDLLPVFFFSSNTASQQGTYITSVQNIGMQESLTLSGEYNCGDGQSDQTLSRRKILQESGHPDWSSVAPMWTRLSISNPLIRDVEEDSEIIIRQNGTRSRYLTGQYRAGDTSILVKGDLLEFDSPFDASFDFDTVHVTNADLVGYSLITLTLSAPITCTLLSTDTCAVFFNDLSRSGWNSTYHDWSLTLSGESTSGEADSLVTAITHEGKYGQGLTYAAQHVGNAALSYQAPAPSTPHVNIFPYLTVRHGDFIFTRNRVDISQGGESLFDGLGSFRTHIMQGIGLLSILYNRYRMDSALVAYLYDSLQKMIDTVPLFFGVSSLSSLPDLSYPAPYTYSVDCYSYPARDEDTTYDVVQVSCAKGEIILPDPTTSRIIQITRTDPGTEQLHIIRDDSLPIRAVFLPGGQTIYGHTAAPYATTVYRGVILEQPVDADTLYVVRTRSGSPAQGESSLLPTLSDKFDSNRALSLKTIKWNNDGASYAPSPNFTPYWSFPFLSSKGANGYEGISPDDASLVLFFGLFLQESEDLTLKTQGSTLINLALPWMAETWKLSRLSTTTNTDFGLYATTRFTTFEMPSSLTGQLVSVQTSSGAYHTFVEHGQTTYSLSDFISADFLSPDSLVAAFSRVVSSASVTGSPYPALGLTFGREGYAIFPYNQMTPPIITISATGYCRLILTDSEGWRYVTQIDNQTLTNFDTGSLGPDPFQKGYQSAPAMTTNPIATVEIHGNNSTATLVWLSNVGMVESTFKGGNIHSLTAPAVAPITINSLVDVGEPYQGAFPHFIGKTGLNPYTPTTDTPFRGPLSVLQQSPVVYALEDDIGASTASIRLVKEAQEYYYLNARRLPYEWDGQIDSRTSPFLTGVAPTYTYAQNDSPWAQSSSPGFSWLSPLEDWSDARSTYRMYFHLALYWRQSTVQATDYPSILVEVLQRMVGGIQYLYNVVYAVGTEDALTKANIAVSGAWPSYMKALKSGDNRLFWCGFGKDGPCVGHNFGAVCYALATTILAYQAGLKDQKVFDYINRMINTLYAYAGSEWWTRQTELNDPVLTANWTNDAYTNAPSLEDFYILDGEDYGILMFTLGLIDSYFTDIDTQDSFNARFPALPQDRFVQLAQIQDAQGNFDYGDSMNESGTGQQVSVIPSTGASSGDEAIYTTNATEDQPSTPPANNTDTTSTA